MALMLQGKGRRVVLVRVCSAKRGEEVLEVLRFEKRRRHRTVQDEFRRPIRSPSIPCFIRRSAPSTAQGGHLLRDVPKVLGCADGRRRMPVRVGGGACVPGTPVHRIRIVSTGESTEAPDRPLCVYGCTDENRRTATPPRLMLCKVIHATARAQ